MPGVVLRAQVTARQVRIIAAGDLHAGNAHLLLKVVVAALRCYPVARLDVDLAGLESIDYVGSAALEVCRRHCRTRKISFQVTGLTAVVRAALTAAEQHQLLHHRGRRMLTGPSWLPMIAGCHKADSTINASAVPGPAKWLCQRAFR